MGPIVAHEDRVSALVRRLPRGRDHAVTAKALSVDGFSDRELRALIHEATERGVLVCADNAGYFVPTSRAEVDECVRRLKSQGQEMLARAMRLEKLAHRDFSGRLF